MPNEVSVQTTTPASLISQAIEKGLGMEHLKELMDLQERWEKKEARKAFFDALSLFQSKVPELKKNRTAKIPTKTGGSYTYNYSDLGGITKAIKGVLLECGLAYRWEFKQKDGTMEVTCFISHRDGHTEMTSMSAGMDNSGAKNDIQQKGSTQTYLQRYTLIGALGLSTAEEDNDGKTRPKSQQQEVQPKDLSEEDMLQLWTDEVNKSKTPIALTQLYLKNKKTVDNDKKIQAIFKQREIELKPAKTEKISMP